MKKTSKAPSAEAIAKLADSGKSVSRFFTNKGVMMKPVQRVNVDFAPGMLQELDREAAELNISRQAVIKSLLRNALDQRIAVRPRPTRSSQSITEFLSDSPLKSSGIDLKRR